MMPGMQPLNGPHGLESILKAYETSSLDGTIIQEIMNIFPQPSPTFVGINNFGITAPTLTNNGIGPMGQLIPKV